jgi:predicted branched-subunit amino acid permease
MTDVHQPPTVSPALDGARAMLPMLVGVAPLGLVLGVNAAAADLSGPGWLSGLTIYSGSAQLAAVELLDKGAGPVMVVLVAVVINLRLGLYSAAMAEPWRGVGPVRRAVFAYLLVDPSYAVSIDGYQRAGATVDRHRFYLGAAVTLWASWQALIAIGMVFGPAVPAALHLEFAVPLCLVAIVATQVDGSGTRRAALTAAMVAVAGHGLPLGTGLPLAIVAGIAAGVGRER